jgi:phosphopantothenoylcysteine decarboxylase/phosphopantothenate--cysteine ligase
MAQLGNRHILVGVTGGIAAYKAAELVRRLREQGAEVRVVMTSAGCEFIAPLTLQALSGNAVHTDLLDPAAEAAMGHIELARWAELVLVAPATADFMARLAGGHADDLLSTLCLATAAPLVLAPAMNQAMWRHPATRANAELLRSRGVRFAGPGEGEQACGDVGPGRMLEPAALLEAAQDCFGERPLAGVRVLVTAGPTREAIDPVRYLSNSSSGKMGFALAAAAADAGAEVTLVAGPVQLPTPRGVSRIDVRSAAEMHAAVMQRAGSCALFIACAAVADYRPADAAGQKIKKDADELLLRLVRNPDILAEVAALARPPFTVGFAAETEKLLEHARAKLQRKGLDMIVANDVARSDIGFDSDRNEVSILGSDGSCSTERGTKHEVARAVIAAIGTRLRPRTRAPA